MLISSSEFASSIKKTLLIPFHRITETLSEEVLGKLHASPKSSYPTIDATSLEKYDAFLFGIPTRFGNFPAQWKTFWDTTGKQWSTGGFWGKYVGLFIGTATQGGGQESTALAAMSTIAAHGMIYVPLGYKTSLSIQSGLGEARGGSPWGAGTYTVSTLTLDPGSGDLWWCSWLICYDL
jgi:NAD(P)H dehydrogenase (quinone)